MYINLILIHRISILRQREEDFGTVHGKIFLIRL